MRVLKSYQCEICRSIYEHRADALACERQGIPGAKLKVGDIILANGGFGWFDGDKAWISISSQRDPGYSFYYVIPAIDLDLGRSDTPGYRHRTRYHLFTGAMSGKQGYQSGYTYDSGHLTPRLVKKPPKEVAQASLPYLGLITKFLL